MISPGHPKLLQGDSKGLWLRGTHARRNTKADSRTITGPDLRAALSPFDDATFAMASARSALTANPTRVALKGTVGTTPQRSLVWNRPTENFEEFLQCAVELLTLLESTLDSPTLNEPIFPVLAQRTSDISELRGAYEISCADPAQVPTTPSESDEAREAAELLQQAVLNMTAEDNSPNFNLDVGLNMSTGGRLRGRVTTEGERVHLSFGLVGEPTDPPSVHAVRDALGFTDLLTIYYASGHTLSAGGVYRPRIKSSPFQNWTFCDFAGYDIVREKPAGAGSSAAQIHAAIGYAGDESLFSWVVHHFNDGWLTCDDGSGEIADFVQCAPSCHADCRTRFVDGRGTSGGTGRTSRCDRVSRCA